MQYLAVGLESEVLDMDLIDLKTVQSFLGLKETI
jgi:hypothetical protein